MTDAPDFIATLTKNGREDVRVALTEFNGCQLIDVRTWASLGTPERVATKKGVSLQVGRLPALIKALQKARDEAERRGLLS